MLKNLSKVGCALLSKNNNATLLAKSLSTSNSLNQDIKNVTVVGGGLMGSGIVQVCAQNDFNVTIVDSEDEYLQKCLVTISKSLDRITKKKFQGEPKASRKIGHHKVHYGWMASADARRPAVPAVCQSQRAR